MGPILGAVSTRRREPPIQRHSSAGIETAGFERFELSPELLRALQELDYESPRPIQEHALPPALAGRDVLGLAQTGTGKTAAFALPVLQQLAKHSRRGPRALVLTPTRELAAQVQTDFDRLGKYTRLRSEVLIGGVATARQERALRRRPEVLVACPGRLLDLMNRGAVKLDDIEVLVLDEADHMFDMGFLPDVRRILAAVPEIRQTLLFSATMPLEIRRLADRVLRDPKIVELEHSRPVDTVAHSFVRLDERHKLGALEELLADPALHSAILFLRTKRRAQRLALRLMQRGHAAVALQGNMSQSRREKAIKGFREGHFQVLVATDVAARGLDMSEVSHVVNVDVPRTADSYTHRIGRTGRSGRTGTALTFVTAEEAPALRKIEKALRMRIPRHDSAECAQAPQRSPRVETRPTKRRSKQRASRSTKQGNRPSQGHETKTMASPLQPTQALRAPFGQGLAD